MTVIAQAYMLATLWIAVAMCICAAISMTREAWRERDADAGVLIGLMYWLIIPLAGMAVYLTAEAVSNA